MSTRDRVLSPQDTDDDAPEIRFSIDEEAYQSDEVGLTLWRGNGRERFRVTDEDEAIYEDAGVEPTWCEVTIRRLGLHLDVITE
ncbi:hypothetical protein [Halobaculum rubrum]|uniref:hypothetical protein n=1 Tax=Halobaculum rubrum TaxID=2872158 RepID=UPI001CA3A8AF|nr:hypothetical protein [Halobaculum rubrum]QZX99819.1 hypothetical protein K6T25_01535 [Halobaculum rubrum]QZX99856.1 hypothetical protein K6T25_01730 [Halobaculum rubrum]